MVQNLEKESEWYQESLNVEIWRLKHIIDHTVLM